jgi:hypothetical protein
MRVHETRILERICIKMLAGIRGQTFAGDNSGLNEELELFWYTTVL